MGVERLLRRHRLADLRALTLSTGYEKTGLGRRIALSMVRVMGRSTLGLGYAVMLADLAIAPFTPSNTGRSAGVIYPIVRSIPALYGSAPGPTARRIGAYLMWTAFAATSVTSSMFLTALAPNLLATRPDAAGALARDHVDAVDAGLPAGRRAADRDPAAARLPDLPAGGPVEPGCARLGAMPSWRGWAGSRPARCVMGFLILLAFMLWVFGRDWINATTAILAGGLADGDPPGPRLGGSRRQPGGLGHGDLFRDPHGDGRWPGPRRSRQVGRRGDLAAVDRLAPDDGPDRPGRLLLRGALCASPA